MKLNTFKANSIVFILLFFSGNPLATFLFGKYSVLAGIVLTITTLNAKLKLSDIFPKKIKLILLTISIIAFLQYITLPVVSFLAIGNLVIKIILGFIIVNSLNERFPYILFRVVASLSLISLIGYFTINMFDFNLPFLQIGPLFRSYLIYGNLPGKDLLRNNGMFWEPGAFAGVLTLCLALNFRHLKYYWAKYRFQLISIILALLTTQSTTGYLVGFFIIMFYFIKPRNFGLTFFVISALLSVASIFYQTSDFLKKKIETQFENSTEQKIGEFSNTRFGSIIFDWHYFVKHPFIGNGFDNSTRYADHQYLFIGESSDAIGSGNSFSNYIASMGIVFVFGYFVLLWKSATQHGMLYAMLLTLVIFFNLQGEQWFNFPLYLGLPFISFYDNKISLLRHS